MNSLIDKTKNKSNTLSFQLTKEQIKFVGAKHGPGGIGDFPVECSERATIRTE